MVSIQGRLVSLYFGIQRAFRPPFSAPYDVAKERMEVEAMAKQFGHFSGADCTPVMVDGIPGEWIVPKGVETQRCILHLHGGTFLAGSVNSHRPLAANIAIASKARVLLIDYRLAPENPFPAGPQDTLAAYLWMLKQGIRAENIVVLGDSAGGALAIDLLIMLREQGKPMPAAVVCLSPALDLTFEGETWATNARRDVMLISSKEKAGAALYLNGTDPHDPLASPLFADPLGFPPMLIQVGSCETLVSDAKTFTEKARSAGVDVTLEIWDGMQHEWQFAVGLIPEAKKAIAKIAQFIWSRIP